MTELAEAGILTRTKDPRGRLICWTADDYLALVSLTERSIHRVHQEPRFKSKGLWYATIEARKRRAKKS